jgi:DNA-binding NarL/FixJ family response regulator
LRPDVVLVDLALSGAETRELSLIAELRVLGAEVLALASSTDPLVLAEAVEAGATGFVTKMAPVEDLADTVRRAARREPLLSLQRRTALLEELRRNRAERRARHAPFATLTPREAAVLHRLMMGESAETISAASYVSLTTVRSQIRAILTKLGVSSQLAAVAMAYQAGWTAGVRQ